MEEKTITRKRPNHWTPEYIQALCEWKGRGFDLRTEIKDPQSGEVVKYQPYRLTVDKEKGTIYYRKDESGKEIAYYDNGQPIYPDKKKVNAHGSEQLSK